MRRIRVVMAMLAVGLLSGTARAGLYNLSDPLPQHLPPLPYAHDQMQLILGPLRAAAVPPLPNRTSPYAEQAAALEKKAPDDLTTSDRVDLGACYVRLNRPNDAVRVLLQADQSNFLVLANLAAAYQATNELDRALAFEEQALAAWPSIQPGWNGNELGWYRRAEGYSLKLLESRQRESQANPGNRPPATLDLLFGKPRSPVGGDYEAQEQPWKLWGDLPPDAFNVVAQLLVWAPNDDRLYWQLGEILNSVGLVPEAVKVFDELSFVRKFSARDFMAHRRALKESLDVADALVNAYGSDTARYQKDCYYLMLEIAPRGLLSAPGVGDACDAIAPAAVAEAYSLQEQQQQPGGPPAPASYRGWWPDWQAIFIGFAAGLIVATLSALQWMEWRKRRRYSPRLESPPSSRTEPTVHDAAAFGTDDPAAPDRVEGAS